MINFICSAVTKKDFPHADKEIVFVGRSNVGKSSLINALYKNKLAYVGKTPGKTRLINFFNINDEYVAVYVPGYGFARRSSSDAIQYANMIDDYFPHDDKIILVIMIVDSRIGLTNDDLDMKDYLDDMRLPYVVVANKIDKLSNNELMNNKHKLFADISEVIYVSAEKKKNIDQLEKRIFEAVR